MLYEMSAFFPQEKIVGISITENDAKILVLEKAGRKISLEIFKKVKLEKGIIENGELKDKERFLAALKKLIPSQLRWSRPVKAIVSLPERLGYYLTIAQTNVLSGAKLSQSVGAQLEMHSPIPKDESYWDFEEYPLKDKNAKEIFVASAPKNKIEEYLQILAKTGFYVVATETQLQSLRRVLKLDAEPLILSLIQEGGVQSAVFKNKTIRFSRFTPWQDMKNIKEEVQEELFRIIEYYGSQNPKEKIAKVYIIKPPDLETNLEKDLAQSLKIPVEEAKSSFSFEKKAKDIFKNKMELSALGPAIRALVPRGKDKLISLMAQGTEELHEISQIITVSRLIRDGVIIVGMIFIIIFTGTAFYLLPNQESQKQQEINLRQARPAAQEIQELEQSIQNFNSKTQTLVQINETFADWNIIIGDARVRIKPGIDIRSMSMDTTSDTVSIAGNAENIGALIDFRNTLSFSGLLKGELTIPFASFESEGNISFDYSLKYKNKGDIFPFREATSTPAIIP